ncbi:hypothetical protein D922_02700 [Enterococcus faecalis 06-MB-DW-09]|nr:hypothetical protein D922_02700 [Enterococcus faecalis 06-MB-DW-09]
MKKIRLATVAVLTSTILAGGVSAFANEVVGNGTTENSVSFRARGEEDGDGEDEVVVPGPIDPEEEIDPIDPIDPEEGGKGPLRIIYVPQTFDFGEQVISVNDQSTPMIAELYSANEGQQQIALDSFAQIIDERGTHEGWTLSVGLSDFTAEDGHTISGAALEFIDPEIDYPSVDGTVPTAPSGISTVNAGGAGVNLLTANEGQGAGRTSVLWGDENITETGINENIRLFIPGASSQNADSYEAQLTWTLSSTVAANGETNPEL